MARVIDKDKKFIYVAYDGEMNKEDVNILLGRIYSSIRIG